MMEEMSNDVLREQITQNNRFELNLLMVPGSYQGKKETRVITQKAFGKITINTLRDIFEKGWLYPLIFQNREVQTMPFKRQLSRTHRPCPSYCACEGQGHCVRAQLIYLTTPQIWL